jgi:hypothetical protein
MRSAAAGVHNASRRSVERTRVLRSIVVAVVRARASLACLEEFVMSASEIADNKWELEASKPPIVTPSGIAQMVLFCGFIGLFGYIIGNSVVGIITPKKESTLGEMYKNMRNDGSTAPAEQPEKQ